jgi:tRNA G18 (ribose-2'-O)-methylase SpoU
MDQNFNLYFQLKDKDLKKDGILIAEGKDVVDRLIGSGIPVHSVLCINTLAEYYQHRSQGRFPVYILNKNEISQITGFPFHRGALAAGIRPKLFTVENNSPMIDLTSTTIICPSTDNPDNLGSIIRTARAFGIKNLILGKNAADPFSRKTIRVSMGNVFYMQLHLMQDENKTIRFLKDQGIQMIGAVLRPKSISIKNFNYCGPKAVIFGNEYNGLSELWLDACDVLVQIPIADDTDSLNVSVSAGIILYQLSG